MHFQTLEKEDRMKIYEFDREGSEDWEEINVDQISDWYKFVGWICPEEPEKSVLLIFSYQCSTKLIVKSFTDKNITKFCTDKPNAAGEYRDNMLLYSNSMTFNFDTEENITAFLKGILGFER